MIRWPAPAKLNLFLYITGRRPNDNYHNLQTLFQFLDYSDYLTFERRADNSISLLTPIANVPNDRNLIVIAARALQTYAAQHGIVSEKPLGADIRVEKTLPMGGGLGGASSNAATTLLALNQLWQLNIAHDDLLAIGRKIGADVPIFIHGYSAFAEGIGDVFQPATLPEKWFLVVQPAIEVSTATIFNHPDLMRTRPVRSLQTLLQSPFSNDCEPLVAQLYPKIAEIIAHLNNYAPTRLTGTGSCVFAEFDSQADAEAVSRVLPVDYDAFIARGINRSPIHAELA